jgi:hypothetical protein
VDSSAVDYEVELLVDVHPFPETQSGEGLCALNKLLPPNAVRRLVIDPHTKTIDLVVAANDQSPARALMNLLRVVEVVMLDVFPNNISEISTAVVTRMPQEQQEPPLEQEPSREQQEHGHDTAAGRESPWS